MVADLVHAAGAAGNIYRHYPRGAGILAKVKCSPNIPEDRGQMTLLRPKSCGAQAEDRKMKSRLKAAPKICFWYFDEATQQRILVVGVAFSRDVYAQL
jgi:hypothetical protein